MTTDPHRHEWIEQPGAVDSEAYRCAECELTSDLCHVCSGPSGSSLWICERCLEREQQVVRDVERYLDLWDERDRHREKSSAAFSLVQASGSGEGGAQGPEDVLSILWSWVARWAEHLGASNATPADYLATYVMWAVHNPNPSGWDDYQRDMRRARGAARTIVGLNPERLPQRCPLCSGKVVRDREQTTAVPCPDGLQDEVRCMACRHLWRTEEAFMRAARAAVGNLAHASPDALVTVEQARKIWPDLKAATVRSWAYRGHIQPQPGGTATAPLYRLADIRERLAA